MTGCRFNVTGVTMMGIHLSTMGTFLKERAQQTRCFGGRNIYLTFGRSFLPLLNSPAAVFHDFTQFLYITGHDISFFFLTPFKPTSRVNQQRWRFQTSLVPLRKWWMALLVKTCTSSTIDYRLWTQNIFRFRFQRQGSFSSALMD